MRYVITLMFFTLLVFLTSTPLGNASNVYVQAEMTSFQDNLDDYLDDLARETPKRKQIVMWLDNESDHAIYLQDRNGYYVVDDAHLMQSVDRVLEAEVTKPVLPAVTDIERSFDEMMEDEVGFLQSFTAEMRPPLRKGQPPRPAHPGHWADVTGDLASSFKTRVGKLPVRKYPYTPRLT